MMGGEVCVFFLPPPLEGLGEVSFKTSEVLKTSEVCASGEVSYVIKPQPRTQVFLQKETIFFVDSPFVKKRVFCWFTDLFRQLKLLQLLLEPLFCFSSNGVQLLFRRLFCLLFQVKSVLDLGE